MICERFVVLGLELDPRKVEKDRAKPEADKPANERKRLT